MKNKIIVFLFVGASLLSSCSKMLEEKTYDFISPNNFYQNGEDAIAAVSGVYNVLYSTGVYKAAYWLIDLDSDHASGAGWFLGSIGAGNPLAYWGINTIWNDHYLLIARANGVLANVPNIKMNEELKQRLLGEAYFLRGWAYFNLVRIYGGVPLRDKTLASGALIDQPRASVSETYNFIISDLKKAEEMLFPHDDSRSGEKGRVTKAVASATLAKVYITMASGALKGASITVRGGQNNTFYTYAKDVVKGYEGFNSLELYEEARKITANLILSKEYSLFPNFMDLWTIENRNRVEHMWQIQALNGNPDLQNDLNYYFNAAKEDRSNVGAVWMSNNHYNNYEDHDHRVLYGVRHQFIVNYGDPNNNGFLLYPERDSLKYKTDAAGNVYSFNGDYHDHGYSEKYSKVSDPKPQNSDAFFPELRFAEVFLMHAEAENEVNGPTPAAYASLNEIRTRSKASTVPTGMSKQDFRSFVLEERGRELVFEGKRRFDLLRWGIYLQVMNQIAVDKDNISKVRAKRNLLFPIPIDEINSNKAINENNPDW
ncbi:RagB/SusD family nutrient uptake outer membrane protein [Pseudopedobacter beijingensis]|uniref:RagB/SusD family nutrient uptake outer membrane protein n=1 Tax=Pseudopedobacter beijingensis TaxID=1207056 RepID=A0ABW4I9N6_9SPHI